jgi:hypothetical protein
LPHGSELGLLTAYVAPLAEIEQLCGSDALGCYGGNLLATIGDAVDWVPPEDVARHEYGHHVAFNRSNAPWLAVDWGTKRWASYASICARAASGTVYPGDEDAHYRLNPGEAFAETYRVMAEVKAGATGFAWSLVDASFSPDPTALRAVEEDVAKPWTAPTASVAAARFRPKGSKTWALNLATPLDGLLEARLTMPTGALYNVSLLSADGKTTLAKSLWSGTGEKALSFQVCGQRSVLIRVTRKGQAGRFRVAFSRP